MIANNNIDEVRIPLVSICCFTYNHEDYVKQALESFLMQRTSFPIEIIVHDDASNDNTKKIIEEYALKFPQIIKLVFQIENLYSLYGINFIFKSVTSQAKGKYIALCAGDDYWIDPLKLQKQVDFLESNPNYGLVHTKAVKYIQEKNVFDGFHGYNIDSFEELLTENSIAAHTVCLRKGLLKEYFEQVRPHEHKEWPAEDFPAWLWFMQHSKIKHMEDITSVYRERLGSICHIEDDYKRLEFSEGIYDIVDYYLNVYSNLNNEMQLRASYYSRMIKMYFLTRQWDKIQQSTKIFYSAKDWFNIFWIGITLPFFYSRIMIKASYRVRSLVFDLLNIYTIRK